MQTQQHRWTPELGWADFGEGFADADLVLAFADTPYFQTTECFEALRSRFGKAVILGCSSSGSVLGTRLSDDDDGIPILSIKDFGPGKSPTQTWRR